MARANASSICRHHLPKKPAADEYSIAISEAVLSSTVWYASHTAALGEEAAVGKMLPTLMKPPERSLNVQWVMVTYCSEFENAMFNSALPAIRAKKNPTVRAQGGGAGTGTTAFAGRKSGRLWGYSQLISLYSPLPLAWYQLQLPLYLTRLHDGDGVGAPEMHEGALREIQMAARCHSDSTSWLSRSLQRAIRVRRTAIRQAQWGDMCMV
jgi:hypothetical protein